MKKIRLKKNYEYKKKYIISLRTEVGFASHPTRTLTPRVLFATSSFAPLHT